MSVTITGTRMDGAALSVTPAQPPVKRWVYNNYHPLLPGLILECATGQHVADYLSEKIWQTLDMEAPASWSLDSRHAAFEKMERHQRARNRLRPVRPIYAQQRRWSGSPDRRCGMGRPVDETEHARTRDRLSAHVVAGPRAARPFLCVGNVGQFIYVAPDRYMWWSSAPARAMAESIRCSGERCCATSPMTYQRRRHDLEETCVTEGSSLSSSPGW